MINENKSTDPNITVPNAIARKISIQNKIVDAIADKIDPNQKVPLNERFAILSNEQKTNLERIEERSFIHFTGQLDELESAIGMLRMGHHLGWKVLYMIHSKKTIRKYEEILDIKVRELFPERGPSAGRSIGLRFAEGFSNFWKVVSGEVKIVNRREIE